MLFPAQGRFFVGQRWVSILLRSLHLFGVAGVGAAFLFNVEQQDWMPYLLLTVISGSLMFLLEIYSNALCLLQLRGLATLVKLAILSLVFFFEPNAMILASVIMLSGIMSHAPGKVRYFIWLPFAANWCTKS